MHLDLSSVIDLETAVKRGQILSSLTQKSNILSPRTLGASAFSIFNLLAFSQVFIPGAVDG
jgi:hypothetical protein